MKANVYENDRTPDRLRHDQIEKNSLAGGVLYLLTFVSVPQFALYASVRNPNYIVGPGPDTGVIIGGILEIIVALAGIATAVALYPGAQATERNLHPWALLARESWKPAPSSPAWLR